MKRYLYLIGLIILIAGCGHRTVNQTGKPLILVSILPQKTFVEKIAGDDFDISVLIPHGANPTTYTLLPAQMAEISRASSWFRMGYVGFELSWAEKIIQTNPSMKVIDLSQGLELIAGARDETTGVLTGVDPHTWLSPALVKQMARTIRDELMAINPGKAEEYNTRYQDFINEIEETDIQIRQLLEDAEGRPFITFHPSLSYFARDYRLVQHSLRQQGKEPTPSHIAGLINLAKENNIQVIFIQSDFDRENARMFAQEIGGEIVQVWPLNPEWSENLIKIAGLLSENFR